MGCGRLRCAPRSSAVVKLKDADPPSVAWAARDHTSFASSEVNGKVFRILSLESEPQSWARSIGLQLSVNRLNKPVEEHPLNARMIVEVFDVAKARYRAACVHMKRRGAMGRDRASEAGRYRGALEESGESLAAGCVQLQNVDGFGVEHAPEVQGVVAVFAGGNFDGAGNSIANSPHVGETVGAYGFLEPGNVVVNKMLRKPDGLSR